jgi:transcriptional regulator with XRE-family HTH domain
MARTSVGRRASQDWLRQMEGDRGTAGTSVTQTLVPAATRTAAALLTEDAADIRNRAKNLTVDAEETHQLVYQHEWSVLTQQRGAQSPVELLNELAELGFAWRDIARLIGVSVPAVQKWRRGERLSGDNRLKVASLMAACDFIASHYYVDDIASWFEMRILEGVPVTPIDLWASGQQIVFFDYVTRHVNPEEALTKYDPEWRERYRSDFETFRGDDGAIGIRMRDR